MAMKAEICTANPDATQKEGFIKWLEYEAIEPMPEYLRDLIRASWETSTYRTELEMTMGDQHMEMTQAAQGLMEYYEMNEEPDSVRWVWQQIRTTAARYAEAVHVLGQGNYAEAIAVVQSIPTDHVLKTEQYQEQQRMLNYISLLATAKNAGRDAYHLSTAEVAQLESLRVNAYDRSANWISNLLCVAYHSCRAPLTGGEAGAPKSRRPASQVAHDTPEGPNFRTAPNPAQAWVTFTYDLKEQPTENAFVVVKDAVGRQIVALAMPNRQGQLVMDTRELAKGMYTVSYTVASRSVQLDRLILE